MAAEGRFGCHIIVGGSCRIHNLDANERERAGSIKTRNGQIRGFEEEGTFASAKRSHLPMGAGALGDEAYPAALKNVGELIPNPIIDSAMATKPFTVAHKVARIGFKRIATVDRSSSRDTAVACCCWPAAATELMLLRRS